MRRGATRGEPPSAAWQAEGDTRACGPEAPPAGRVHAPADRSSRQIFCCEGEYWTIEYAGVTCRLRDSAGMRYLAALLARGGGAIAAIDLQQGNLELQDRLRATPAAERARVSVTRAIRAALARISRHHPVLGAHLRASIHTGQVCSYRPASGAAGQWQR